MSSKSSIAKKIEKLKRRRAQSFAPSISDFQDAETDENENIEIEEPQKRKKTKKSKLIGTDLPWQRVSMPDLNADLDAVGAAGLIEEIDPEVFFSANPQLKDKPVEVKNDVSEEMDLDEDAAEKPKKQKEKKKKKVAKPQKPKESKTEQEGTIDADVEEFEQPVKKDNQIPSEPPKCLKSEWGSFNLDHKFLYAIDDLGFETPTPIQLKSIPAALRDRKDIVGAAETGSGKTIAFGLPILQQVLEIKEKEARAKKAQAEGSTEEIETKKLSALILTPTRELAVQISRHLKQLTKYTNIKVIPVIGGISIQKQHRLLRGKPEIVVATPGRFWELTNGVESHEYLSDLTSLRFLVLDEADRMIETGHYKELFYILESIKQTEAKLYERDSVETAFRGEEQDEEDDEGNKKNGKKKVARQTFLFSATLTMKIHKGKIIRSKSDTSIDKLLDVMKFERKIELIDLSTKEMMAATLTEHRIDCMLEDKDIYLYYVLQFFGGSRTLVFVNSISTMKRLLPLLQLLQLNVCGLHAQMQQKQRLKNLERFQSQLNSVLVATDVAARGLDIPLVDHVIHYQLPKVPQMYVHRSGRAGRAQQKGTVVALVSPEDKNQYDTILKSTNKKEDIPLFEVDASFLKDIRERVALARQVEHELYLMSKQNTQSRDWLVKTANEELDAVIASSSGGGEDEDEQYNKNRHAKYVNGLKNQLKRVLKQPLTNNANIRVMSVKQHEKSKGKNTTNFSQVNNAVTMTSLPFMVVKERYKGSREQMQQLSNASKGIKGDPSRRGKRTGSKKIAYS